jgi:hypothetical protein
MHGHSSRFLSEGSIGRPDEVIPCRRARLGLEERIVHHVQGLLSGCPAPRVSRTSARADDFIEAEQTYPPGIASTSTPTPRVFRSFFGS